MMNPKLLALLGLSADASEMDVVNAVTALVGEPEGPKFEDLFPEKASRLAEMEDQLKDKTVDDLLAQWTTGAKNGLPPVVLDDVRKFRRVLSGEPANEFDGFMAKLLETGFVTTENKGSDQAPEAKEPKDVFAAAVEAKVAEGMSYSDALAVVSKEMPEAAMAYLGAVQNLGGDTGTE